MNKQTIIVTLFALLASFTAKGERLSGKRMIEADKDSLAILVPEAVARGDAGL